MIFLDDVLPGLAWLTPAPIGTVEDGWAGVVADLLRHLDAALASRPGTTVDVLGAAERDGTLLFDFVVDGAGAADTAVTAGIRAAVADAQVRAAATCTRCGRPGRLRHDRPGWPATRCDDHAVRVSA